MKTPISFSEQLHPIQELFHSTFDKYYALWEEVKLLPGFKEVGVLKKSPYLISFTPQGHLGSLCDSCTCGMKLTVSPLSCFPEFKSQILGRKKVWGTFTEKKKKVFFETVPHCSSVSTRLELAAILLPLTPEPPRPADTRVSNVAENFPLGAHERSGRRDRSVGEP